MKRIILLLLIVVFCFNAKSQIGINSPLPNKFSALEVKASGKGMYFPRIEEISISTFANKSTIANGFFSFRPAKNNLVFFRNRINDPDDKELMTFGESKILDSANKIINSKLNLITEANNQLKSNIDLIETDTQWVYICENINICNYPNDGGYILKPLDKKVKINDNWTGNLSGFSNSFVRFRKDNVGNLLFETKKYHVIEADHLEISFSHIWQSIAQSDTLIFTLPIGYRPNNLKKILVYGANADSPSINYAYYIFFELLLKPNGQVIFNHSIENFQGYSYEYKIFLTSKPIELN